MNPALHTASAAERPSPVVADPDRDGSTFGGAVSSELLKLAALRTAWVLSVITLVLGVLVAGSAAFSYQQFTAGTEFDTGEPLQLASQGMTGSYFAMILLGALGVLTITTEYASGSIRSSVTAVPQRSRLLAAKALALAVWTAVVTAAMILLSHIVVALITEPVGMTDVVADAGIAGMYAATWASVVLTVLMGFGLGTLLRSSAGGIVMLAVILFVVQIALTILWGITNGADWTQTLLQLEYMSLVGQFTEAGDGQMPGMEPLARWQAGLGILVWTAVPVLAGWMSFLRRDV